MGLAWFPASYVFGAGKVAYVAEGAIELIPYVSGDGSGRVAGWSVWRDRRCLGRHPGPIERALAAAEEGANPPADRP